jgi:predicted DsbA family dithiol-disulfide isomerase
MLIEVYSDTICPWCYLGFARLQQALAQRPAQPVDLRWLPFELNPDLPAGGRDRAEYLRERFGDVDRFAKAQATLQALGAEAGIGFDFAAIRRMPNTRRSHALIAWAGGQGAQNEIKRRALAAYFAEGRDIGDPDTLAAIAAEAGLDAVGARAAVDDPRLHEGVAALEAQARAWRISGVPTFIFGRRFAFSGAQPLPVFLQAIDAATAETGG